MWVTGLTADCSRRPLQSPLHTTQRAVLAQQHEQQPAIGVDWCIAVPNPM